MAKIGVLTESKVNAVVADLKDVRPTLLGFFFPSMLLNDSSRVSFDLQTKDLNDLWNFQTEETVIEELDLDEVIRFWRNDECLYPIPPALYKFNKIGPLGDYTKSPYYQGLLKSKIYKDVFSYLHIGQTNKEKEEKLVEIVDHIEEYVSSFEEGYEHYTFLIDEINRYKAEIEETTLITEKDIEDAKDEREIEKSKLEKRRDDLNIENINISEEIKNSNKQIYDTNELIKSTPKAASAILIANSINTTDGLKVAVKALEMKKATLNAKIELNKIELKGLTKEMIALKLKPYDEKIARYKKICDDPEKIIDELKKKIQINRNKFHRFYGAKERLELIINKKFPDKFALSPKVSWVILPDQKITINFELNKGIPFIHTNESEENLEKWMAIETLGLEDKTKVKVELLDAANGNILKSYTVDFEAKTEMDLGSLTSENSIFWRGEEFEKMYRGLLVNAKFDLKYKLNLPKPDKYATPNGEKKKSLQFGKIDLSLSDDFEGKTIIVKLSDELNSIGFKQNGEVQKFDDNVRKYWYTKNPFRVFKGNILHSIINMAIEPKPTGKCANFTHMYAHNYIAIKRGFNTIDSPQKKTGFYNIAADGNANDFSYHKKLITLGYSMIDEGWKKRDEISSHIKNEKTFLTDIYVYWCDDYFIKSHKKKDSGLNHKNFGHTCMNNDKLNSVGWSTDVKDNYGVAFSYANDKTSTIYRVIHFFAPIF